MSVLSIALADVKRLISMASTDTSQDGAITALLAAEQPVQEYALDPGILGLAVTLNTAMPPAPVYPGLLATLTLGVTETLAGSLLLDLGRFPHFAEPLPLASLTAQAAALLTVATSDVKRLLSIDPGDTSQDTAIGAQITAEQLALEYALDPAVLGAAVATGGAANAGLKAWLTLGVSEQIAGHYLEQSGRVPGVGVDVSFSSVHIVTHSSPTPDKLGVELAAQGTARLLPFARLHRADHALRPVANQLDLVKRGELLRSEGLARLAPYSRAKRGLGYDVYNEAAMPTVPDGAANVPGVSSALTGDAVAPPASVFDGAFADLAGSVNDGDITGDFYPLWQEPEP